MRRGVRRPAAGLPTLGPAPYNPRIEPSQFVDPNDIGGSVAANPYLPLTAGTRYVYRNPQSGEKVVVDVTHKTIEIAGVRCRIVHDVASDLESGEVIEDTDDFVAQDLQGNVWYFGEVSRNYEDGLLVDLEGSWRAGVDGAKPGILMKAAPQVGDTYRQEFMFGEAEDLAEVLNLHGARIRRIARARAPAWSRASTTRWSRAGSRRSITCRASGRFSPWTRVGRPRGPGRRLALLRRAGTPRRRCERSWGSAVRAPSYLTPQQM